MAGGEVVGGRVGGWEGGRGMGWASYEYALAGQGPSLRFDAEEEDRSRRSMPPYPCGGADQRATPSRDPRQGEEQFRWQRAAWRGAAAPATHGAGLARPPPMGDVDDQREMARLVASIRSPKASDPVPVPIVSSRDPGLAGAGAEADRGVQLSHVVDWLLFNGSPGQIPYFESSTSVTQSSESGSGSGSGSGSESDGGGAGENGAGVVQGDDDAAAEDDLTLDLSIADPPEALGVIY